jgi:MFS family permease
MHRLQSATVQEPGATEKPGRGPLRFVGSRGTAALLRDRNFFPYLAGNMLSGIGTWFQLLGQAILVFRLTDSTFLLGLVGFSSYAAVFLLAPVVGRATDRYDRRHVLILSQLTACAVAAVLCVVTALGVATTPVVIGFALVLGVANSFATPSMMAFVPSLVEPAYLSTALALNSATFNVARAIGPVLAALVISWLGISWAFGLNSLSYLALIAGVLLVRPLTPHRRPSVKPRLLDSVRLVWHDKRLVALLYTIAAMNLATDPPITLGPPFMEDVYHRSAALSGLLIGGFGIGAVLAAFTFAPGLRGTRLTLAATLGAAGAGTIVFALAPQLSLAMVGLFVLGVGFLSSNTAATTRLQTDVDAAHRGRIMVLWSIAFLGARPLGALVDGAVASWAGIRTASVVMALPALAGAAVFLVFGRRSPGRDAARAVET